MRLLLQFLPYLLQFPDGPVGIAFGIRVGRQRPRPVLAVDLLVGRERFHPVPKFSGRTRIVAIVILQAFQKETELFRHIIRELHEFHDGLFGLVVEAVARPVAAVIVVVPGVRKIKEGVLGFAVNFRELGLAVLFQLREGKRLRELAVAGLPARQRFRIKLIAPGKRYYRAVSRPGRNGRKDPDRLVGGQKKFVAAGGDGKDKAERQIDWTFSDHTQILYKFSLKFDKINL